MPAPPFKMLKGIDGWGMTTADVPPRSGPMMPPLAGAAYKYNHISQTGNTAATNLANMSIGTVAVPIVTTGTPLDVVVSDAAVSLLSLIFIQIKEGTTTPANGAWLVAAIKRAAIVAATSFTATFRSGATTLSTDYEFHYWIVN